MKTETKKIVWGLGILIILIVLLLIGTHNNSTTSSTASSTPAGSNLIASADYSCDAGKTIAANFYSGTDVAGTATTPPVPGGSAEIKLSDGRDLTLHQTISADGARYSDGNPNTQGSETFVFWSKGNGALVLENNVQKSYIGCIVVAPDKGGLPNAYSNSADNFSLRYPTGYTPDATYAYQEMGPGKDIHGVKFTIPSSVSDGTNLSDDTYVSVEEIPNSQSCSADLFLGDKVTPQSTTVGGTTYSVADSTGAGAGNRYEEHVYAIPGTNPCVAVRYFIHYGVLENYPAGTVTQFDEQALLSQFDMIRDSLVINQ